MDHLQRLFAFAEYCVDSPYTAPVCRDFWTANYLVAFALATIIVVLVSRATFLAYREFKKNRLRLEARAVVTTPAIKRAKWHDDDKSLDASGAELAAEIRKAIDDFKAKTLYKHPVA